MCNVLRKFYELGTFHLMDNAFRTYSEKRVFLRKKTILYNKANLGLASFCG